jgi:hypothetical protein
LPPRSRLLAQVVGWLLVCSVLRLNPLAMLPRPALVVAALIVFGAGWRGLPGRLLRRRARKLARVQRSPAR